MAEYVLGETNLYNAVTRSINSRRHMLNASMRHTGLLNLPCSSVQLYLCGTMQRYTGRKETIAEIRHHVGLLCHITVVTAMQHGTAPSCSVINQSPGQWRQRCRALMHVRPSQQHLAPRVLVLDTATSATWNTAHAESGPIHATRLYDATESKATRFHLEHGMDFTNGTRQHASDSPSLTSVEGHFSFS